MGTTRMNSLERVFAALSFKESDRVPLFLLFTFYGAKELGVPIKEYFLRPDLVLEAQKRLRKKFNNDCLFAFLYAGIETEAWGGEVIFAEEGPPNSGAPLITSTEMIFSMDPPRIDESPSLLRTLEVTRLLKGEAKDEAPVIGVVLSPFSVPVMQMGFAAYLDILHDPGKKSAFERLMAINEDFCIRWANAQFEAGATAICYFDPLASSDMLPSDLYQRTGFEAAKRVISKLNGPTATALASARTGNSFDLISQTGTGAIAFSHLDDLQETKKRSLGRIALIGNLNAIEMRRWTSAQARQEVKRVLDICAPGGGFILADNHGEVPWNVSEEILHAISDETRSWEYPTGKHDR